MLFFLLMVCSYQKKIRDSQTTLRLSLISFWKEGLNGYKTMYGNKNPPILNVGSILVSNNMMILQQLHCLLIKCRHFDKLSASKEKLVVRQTCHPEFIGGKLSAVRFRRLSEFSRGDFFGKMRSD